MEQFNSIINGHVQKIYACPFFYSFKIRSPGKTRYLYIGKGRFSKNIFLCEKRIDSEHRRKDSYLEKLRKEFLGSRLVNVSEESGFYIFGFENAGLDKKLLFSFRENLLYTGMLLPYKSSFVEAYLLYHKKTHHRFDKENFKLETFLEGQNKLLPKDLCKKTLQENLDPTSLIKSYQTKIQRKNEKKGHKKKVKIEHDIKRLSNFLQLKETLSGHKPIDRYVKNQVFTYEGLSIKNISDEYYKARNQLFEKIKSVKEAIKIQKNRLENHKTKDNKDIVEVSSYVFPVAKKVGTQLEKENTSFEAKKLGQFGVYIIGRNSKENDQLRAKWAAPLDYWFHFKDRPGPHLFLKLNNGVSLTQNVLDQVCLALRSHQSTTLSEINIIYTRVKYLKKVSGTQGKVIPKKEKTYRAIF